jgi:hypothetical protein
MFEGSRDSGGSSGVSAAQSVGSSVLQATYPSRRPSRMPGRQRFPDCILAVVVAPCWHLRARNRQCGCRKTPLRAARRLGSSVSQQRDRRLATVAGLRLAIAVRCARECRRG